MTSGSPHLDEEGAVGLLEQEGQLLGQEEHNLGVGRPQHQRRPQGFLDRRHELLTR
jgi:hypothetical protein